MRLLELAVVVALAAVVAVAASAPAVATAAGPYDANVKAASPYLYWRGGDSVGSLWAADASGGSRSAPSLTSDLPAGRQGHGAVDELALDPQRSLPAGIQAFYQAASAPYATAPPTVSGSPRDGELLTATAGTWDAASAFTFEWQRCDSTGDICQAIDGAAGIRYLLTPEDYRNRVRVRVTASNADGASTSTSSLSPIIQAIPPSNTHAPALLGTTADEGRLDVDPGDWLGTKLMFTYAWDRCDANGANCARLSATASTYNLVPADIGSRLRVTVIGTNDSGSDARTSALTGAVAAIPPHNNSPPGLWGTSTEGGTLMATSGTWGGSPTLTYSWAWLRCPPGPAKCTTIPGANGNSYTLTGDDVGSRIVAAVTAINSVGSSTAVTLPTSDVPSSGSAHIAPPPPAPGASAQTNPPNAAGGDRPATAPNRIERGLANGANRAGAAHLSAAFTANQRSALTVPFGTPTTFGGRLTNERGEGIANAAVEVDTQSVAGGDYRTLLVVTTDDHGEWSATAPAGTSRNLRASYREFSLDRDPAASSVVQLAVTAGGALVAKPARLTLGGQTRFSGQVGGQPIPPAGVPVELEARDTASWVSVARARTGRDGTFAFRYRFCRTVTTHAYTFRVAINPTVGFPFDPGASNGARVHVRVPRRISRRIYQACRGH